MTFCKFTSILCNYSTSTLVPSSSYHMQIKKSYANDNEIQNQELLKLESIYPTWAKIRRKQTTSSIIFE